MTRVSEVYMITRMDNMNKSGMVGAMINQQENKGKISIREAGKDDART